jgi:hypothetical protein
MPFIDIFFHFDIFDIFAIIAISFQLSHYFAIEPPLIIDEPASADIDIAAID